MAPQRPVLLEPRKSPVQARSNSTVESILEATVQVLLSVGKERLTTTRVAHRAGVSVGTLYQYFPNKSALLQATLRRHLETVAAEVERICREERGAPLGQIVSRIANTFLDAKMKDLKTSMALHSVSSDVDGAKIAWEIGARVNKSITSAIAAAREPLRKEPRLVASTVQAAMVGVGRALVESPSPERHLESVRHELILMLHAYLSACSSESSLNRA